MNYQVNHRGWVIVVARNYGHTTVNAYSRDIPVQQLSADSIPAAKMAIDRVLSKIQELEHIHVNESGEFDERCICLNSDFFTVQRVGDAWREVEPVDDSWEAWACIECQRVINAKGEVIDNRQNVTFLE